MNYEGLIFLYIVIGAGVVFASWAWSRARSDELIERWAQHEGFQLLSSEPRTWFRGPFFWRTSKGQTVYYVRVSDAQGRVQAGWLRCGGSFLGLWSDQVQVEWEA